MIVKDLKNTYVKGDLSSLIELTTILLDNAIKYSQVGGKIIIKTEVATKKATLSIQDFGVGIKASALPHLFNRFYRADSSRNKEINGYGLGLSIAKKIVDLHYGKITVESTLGKGSLFVVLLPSYSANSQT